MFLRALGCASVLANWLMFLNLKDGVGEGGGLWWLFMLLDEFTLKENELLDSPCFSW